jgi:predicted dehydrogenase
MDTIKWGVLATGIIAQNFAKDLALIEDAELLAVGSRTADAAEGFAADFDVPRAYGSWTELAADPDVDVIYVATPHNAHHAAAAVCLRAGKAVLLEKPFTVNLAETNELITLASDNNVFLMEAMWTFCNPVVRRMVELIADGAIGDVRSLSADFGIVGPPDPDHRLRNPALAGGALLDLGVYPISFAHLVLGAPQAISSWARLTPDGVDENTGILFGYDSGAVATLSCSIVANGPNMAVVSGTAGRIEIPWFFNPDHFVLHRIGQEPEEVRPTPTPGIGYTHEAAEVMRCLRAGEKESALVPLAGTASVMSTLDAIREQIGVHYPGE